jgi:quercetin dioxygenase-like cupin family protein
MTASRALDAPSARVVRALGMSKGDGSSRVADTFYSERMSTIVVNMVRTEPAPLHVHRQHDEIMVILDGEAEFKLSGDVQRARVGDLLHAPAGVPHAVQPTDSCVLLAVFSPGLHPDRPDREIVGG